MAATPKRYFLAVLPALEEALQGLPTTDRWLFMLRFERYFQDLWDGLEPVYGHREDFGEFLERLAVLLAVRYRRRDAELRELDSERELIPDWFQRETVLGYVFYVERFAGAIKGVARYLDYLEELGVTYVHLMSCLKPRAGDNDGGYAVEDYRQTDPRLGTTADLVDLCRLLRSRGISVCLDLVLNHCAKEHLWARRARAGDPHYRNYFYMYEDRSVPDAFEASLPEIFPDFAPGNFSYYPEMRRWVWTTFHEYQWDLNWSNPEVFLEIIDILLYLANLGVEVFRLDAVAFMWKRLGSNCQNQPEVFGLLQGLRACSRIAAPAVIHKAEAIVSPKELVPYFGSGPRHGKVADVAYHNSLMVQIWSALASRDTRLMTHTLERVPAKPVNCAWATYLRCHDDIGWAVTEEDAAAVGLDGFAHRAFLSDYYSGSFPGSHARGLVFQHNRHTGDRRISGTSASLAGLEAALEREDEQLITLAIERILLGYAIICAFGGVPLLYMGDELGMLNDYRYQRHQELSADNRWVHRPFFDRRRAERRKSSGTCEQRIFHGLQKIIRARRRTPHLHAAIPVDILRAASPQLFLFARRHPLGTLLAIFNLSETEQHLAVAGELARLLPSEPFDRLEGHRLELGGDLGLAPYQRLWLTQAEDSLPQNLSHFGMV